MSRTEIPTIDKDVLAILNGEKTFQEVFSNTKQPTGWEVLNTKVEDLPKV